MPTYTAALLHDRDCFGDLRLKAGMGRWAICAVTLVFTGLFFTLNTTITMYYILHAAIEIAVHICGQMSQYKKVLNEPCRRLHHA